MEGINIAIVAGQIEAIENIQIKSNNGRYKRLKIRRVSEYVKSFPRAKVLSPVYKYCEVYCFGCTAPAGSFVCIPCVIGGAKTKDDAKMFLKTEYIPVSKRKHEDISQVKSFAIVTGEVADFTETKSPNYAIAILKSNDRYFPLWTSNENKIAIGDYILADCNVGSNLFIRSYINMSKDTILDTTDKIKNLFQPTMQTI